MIKPEEILAQITKAKVDQAEVYLSSSKSLQIDVLNGKVEAIDEVNDIGCGIRIIKDHKLGFAYTSDFDETVVEETIASAIENAKFTETDEFHGLPQDCKTARLQDLFDNNIGKTPIEKKITLALQIEALSYKADKRIKKTEKISYSEDEFEVSLANSNGLNASYQSNYCGASAQVIAEASGAMEAGFGMDYVKKIKDLDARKIGLEAAERATQLLGAKAIKSQKLALVFDPHVGGQLLETLATPLSSDATQKGKSLFANKLGQAVGSTKLTIIDNGRLENGLASAPFDGEGVPTQETKLITNGKLSNFLFNTYTANKGKTKSTGNAARGGFMGLPGIGTTNLYIKPGQRSPEDIIKSIKNGLYITRVMGIHTANPISGDFSIGFLFFYVNENCICPEVFYQHIHLT